MLMRCARKLVAVVATLALLGLAGCNRYASLPRGPLKDDRERVSYAYGEQISRGWAQAKVDLDLRSVGRGMDDGLAGQTRYTTGEGAEKTLTAYNRKKETGAPTVSEREQAGYAFGYRAANTWRTLKADVDVLQVLRGIEDTRLQRSLLAPDEGQTLLLHYYDDLVARLRNDRAQLAVKNQQDSEVFLKKNQGAPNVATLPSGLQYKVLARGQGENPKPDGFVGIVYENKRLDGKLVPDASDPSQETVLAMGSLIKGWQEALQMMKPGDRWQLFIPSDLAFGMDGDPRIGPNAALITTMELRRVLAERPPRTAEQNARDNRD